MSDRPELKTISLESVPRALEKAERYRLLNDPEQAESICHDVLAVDPNNIAAKRIMVLALTDQFVGSGQNVRAKHARSFARELPDPYEQKYYLGVVYEREARAYLAKDLSGSFAFESFSEAMELFEEAAKIRPAGNDDAILRYNSCVRTIAARGLSARDSEPEQPLE
jgi:hypothetical protein